MTGYQGTVGRQEDVQKVVNREARLTLGAFRTTNQGALSLESGLRPAAANWTTACAASPSGSPSLPRGDQARELIGASDSALGQRLQSQLGCWNGREEAVLLEVASPLEATTTVDEEEAAANEAKRTDRPGLTIFTDGSRLENGATGYAVAWKKGQTWKDPHGLGPGSLRRRVRGPREGPAGSSNQEPGGIGKGPSSPRSDW